MDLCYRTKVENKSANHMTQRALVIFFRALAQSQKGLPRVLAAKIVTAVIGWNSWLQCLANPMVCEWCGHGNNHRRRARKEALLLLVFVVAVFERASHTQQLQKGLWMFVWLLPFCL